MKKNETFELEITDYSGEGLGIGRQEGFVWFVKDTVIGDRILAAATKVKKNYGFARLLKILSPSGDRVTAACTLARRCGGCQLQEMSYEAQLRFKSEKVYNNLLRIGEIEKDVLNRVFEAIVGMEMPYRYRNKAQFPISRDKSGKLIAGFYAGRTHDVIPCEDCLLGIPENREILRRVLAWMERYHIEPYDEKSGRGVVRHVLIRKGFASGQIMVCLVVNARQLPEREALVRDLCMNPVSNVDKSAGAEDISLGDRGEMSAFRGILHVDSLSYSINMERSNVIMGREIVHLYGPGYIEDAIGSVRFRISPLSFYQVNPVQTEQMYGAALEFAGLKGTETVWDLYCGIGTISLFLSQKARKVYGVEIIPAAIEDARQNAALNGIENAEFYVGAAEEVLPAWYAAHPEERIDVVSVDPPRKGCDERCLETIVSMAPEKIVYVSCDSATLARDLKYLCGHGYELKRVRPVDNFCQTVHVETVALLSKLHEAKHHVNVTVDMDELDLTSAESKATYEEIKQYVAEHNDGMKVSSLYIAQVKQKYGIIERENYNKSKSEDAKQP